MNDGLVKLTNPGQWTSDKNDTLDYNEVTGTRDDVHSVTISVFDIDFYEYNPREEDNDHFENIKESIKTSGLHQKLSVMRNPSTGRFELFNGGNTRLRALKELAEDNSSFENTLVLLHPWINDDVKKIIDHLVENEVRGELLLVDKAKSIALLEKFAKERMGIISEETKNNDNTSDGKDSPPRGESLRKENYGFTSKFIKFLKENNYDVGNETLSICRFTNNYLVETLDKYLKQGIGRSKVSQIRLIYNNTKRFIQSNEIADYGVDDFNLLFRQALGQYNHDEEFNFANLVDTVASYFANTYPFSHILQGNKGAIIEVMLSKTKKQYASETNKDEDSNIIHSSEVAELSDMSTTISEAGTTEKDIVVENNVLTVGDSTVPTQDVETNTSNISSKESSEQSGDLQEMRDKAFQMAMHLMIDVQSDVHARIVLKKIDEGAGFLVTGMPANTADTNDWCLFFVLLDLSLATDPLNKIKNSKINLDHMDTNDKLLNLYLSKNKDWEDCVYDILDISNSPLPIPSIIGSFKRMLPRKILQDLSNLEFLSYQILNQVNKQGLSLWESE